MQIIIVQAEIEESIRNHILRQIQVKPGMEINIELAATRGAAGFTATIDISPSKNPAALQVVTPTPAAEPLPAAPARPVLVQQLTQPTVVQPTAPVVTAADPAFQEDPPVTERIRPAETAQELPAESEEEGAQPAMAMATDNENPAPAPTGKSLFRNLRKPVNS